MNITNIRSFHTIVNCNSISKAAKQLHMSQPGLSMQLQCFENEVGSKLCIRSNRGIELTSAGKLVFEFAETMLSLEDNLQKNLDKLKNQKDTLSVSCCKNLGEQIFPCSIYTFKEIHFNVDVSMSVSNSQDIIKQLVNHEINIGIVLKNDNIPDNVSVIDMLKDELVLVSGEKCELDSISVNELKSLPFILREPGSATLDTLEKYLKNANLSTEELNVLVSLSSQESIKSTLISRNCYSFLPKLSLNHELINKTLKIIKIPNFKMPINYCIVIRKNYTPNAYEQNFINFLTSKKKCFCY